MRILLWQTAYLGDVVLSTPLIRTVLDSFGGSHVAFVGRPFIKDLLRGYPVELITFDKTLKSSLRMINQVGRFDIALSMHRSMRTALILYLSGIKTRIGFDRSELAFLYTDRVKHVWGVHEVDRNLELLKPLDVKNFIREPKLFVDEDEKRLLKEKFELPDEFVVLSPFSNFALKEWHKEGWRRVLEEVNKPVVVVGTKERIKDSQIFGNFINLVGKTSIRELIVIISLAKLVLSCDSSSVHIANALGVPAVCVYTSTSPIYGFYPLLGTYLTPEISCSPCSPNPKKCKTGTFECLRNIKPEDVIKSAKSFL